MPFWFVLSGREFCVSMTCLAACCWPDQSRAICRRLKKVSSLQLLVLSMATDSPISPQVPLPYNGIGFQKLRILARLTQGPATCEQLQRECQSPDPRARIHELRDEEHEITTHRMHKVNPDGSVNHVGLYVLKVKNDRQACLFEVL